MFRLLRDAKRRRLNMNEENDVVAGKDKKNYGFLLPFLLGILLVSVVWWTNTYFENSYSMEYRCFDIENETNFRSSSPADVGIEWDERVRLYEARSMELRQIGKQMNKSALLVISWNRTFINPVVSRVFVRGFNETECPNDVEKAELLGI